MTLTSLLLALAAGAVTAEQLRARGKSVTLWAILVVLTVLLLPRVALRF